MSSQFVTARVEAPASGGSGVVRWAGGVVLVPRVLPGELVRLRVRGDKAVAQGAELLEPSADRIAPACPHAQRCGGCDLMHASVAAQERIHAEVLRGLVEHAARGAKRAAPLPACVVHRAPRPLAYRGRARLHLQIDARGAKLGYHADASRDLVAIDACAVLEPALFEAARSIAAELRCARPTTGELSVAFGLRRGDEGEVAPVVALSLERDPEPALYASLDRRCAAGGDLAGAHVTLAGSARPLVFGDPRPAQRGPDGSILRFAAAGFAQPSAWAGVLLAERARALARPDGAGVLELFSGSGTLSVELARGAKSFASIESSEEAVAVARENLARRALAGKLRVGDAESSAIPKGLDVVVLDPPRSGAPRAARAVAAARPRRVVYVSCDAPTLARDLAPLLASGFRVEALEIAETFPQTSHYETIALLTRGSGA